MSRFVSRLFQASVLKNQLPFLGALPIADAREDVHHSLGAGSRQIRYPPWLQVLNILP